MELVLLGLGGCTAYDVVTILKKSRQNISACTIELKAERADEIPAVFTDIEIHFKFTGENLKHEAIQRAIDLSAEKYCSASIMIGKTATIRHSFEVVPAAS